MKDTPDNFVGVSRALSIVSFGAGISALAVLVGWATDQGWLKAVLPGLSEMRINTALSLAVAAIALWARAEWDVSRLRFRMGTVAAIAVAAMGIANIVQYLLDVDFGIDELFGDDPVGAGAGLKPGRMALNTAFSLALLGGGLALVNGPKPQGRVAAQYALAAALFLPVAALLGYLYSADQAVSLRTASTPMALHTALLLCVLSIGGLVADARVGPMSLVVRRTPAGALMRAAAALFVITIPVIGWIRLQAEYAGVFDLELGIATFAMFNIVFALTITGFLARRIDRQWTALKEADSRLLEAADELFRGVVENSVQGVLISRDWRAVFANAETLRILGCASFEDLRDGPPLGEYIGAEFRQQIVEVRDDLVLRGDPAPSHEVRIVARDGTERWAIIVLRRIEWKDGPATLTLIVETTERRNAEERLRHAQKMDAVGQLTGGAAHEFNNLLAVIIGNAEDLADQLVDHPEGIETVGRILRAADMGARLTGSLLAFSRKTPLRLETLDPVIVLREVEHMARATLPETVRLTVIADNELRPVSTDSAMLQSSILNLILNARDACVRGGEITVRARNRSVDESADSESTLPPGQYVEIAVRDNGEGMSAEVKARIFEPFFSTKETGKGTGLGLPMVLGFTQQMGGRLDVESEAGRGTTVSMFLPIAAMSPSTAAARAPASTRVDRRRLVLVVEDNPDVLMATATMVRKLGYDVMTAIDGPTAVDVFEHTEGIDVLLTDVVMPNGMSGLDTARVLHLRQPWLPVVFMSGYNENVIVHHGVVDQGVTLLSKPFTRAELEAALTTAIRAAPKRR